MTIRTLLHRFRRAVAYLVLPALAVVIWGELSTSRLVAELEPNVWDKALHFTAYFGLALMTTISVRGDRRAFLWALGLMIMGACLEVLQGMTGRDADVWDEVANTLGVLAGFALARGTIAVLKARGLIEDGPEAP
ncbi:MAG: VanZ family protein [Proteobacteria bacterium]|nr:VanZ family protein [Pseudomonadota bacterium]